MNKTHEKRRRDIKSKLMAAICMLLVSSIMMVSSTYAWFTLSTAPEVTGINTAVGANGNLEIALLPKDGLVGSITSGTGDSMLAIEQKNVTWGNLVDLSESSVYGLDKITLYPAALNGIYDTDGKLIGIDTGSMLKTPTYGNDGRVADLVGNTSVGYYDSTEGDFYPNEDKGVRAIGTASGMTPRQLAYRNSRAAANTAAAQAKSVASNSLNNNGSTLANVAIKKGTGTNDFNMADLTSMKNIVDDLLGTTGEGAKTGALQYIETAYKQYILAFAASAQGPADGDNPDAAPWKAVEGLIDSNTLTQMKAALPTDVTLPDALNTAITAYETTLSDVSSARTQLNTLIEQNKATYTWDEISDVLYLLADPDNMKVNGIKAGDIMKDDNMSDLVNSVASGGLKVSMATGGGVYADIADHCGDYTASVVIEEVTYNQLTLKNMTARMETVSTVSPARLTAISTAAETAGAPAGTGGDDMPITDMFGYVIDLAFRTNAAQSNLMLQRDAVDRIYGDNANEGTMGHGSNMTFGVVSNELNETQIKGLMSAIRLVFFTPDETNGNVVIMNAKLDGENATKNDAGEWVAQLALYHEKKGGTTTTYKEITLAAGFDQTATYYSDDQGTPITDNATLTEGATVYVAETTATGAVTEEPVTDDVIMALTQNTAHQLSVLVYLDGNLVGNDDVASQAATSLVGKLNLQFASSATLVPMDYASLHTPNTAAGDTTGGAGENNGGTEEPTNP